MAEDPPPTSNGALVRWRLDHIEERLRDLEKAGMALERRAGRLLDEYEKGSVDRTELKRALIAGLIMIVGSGVLTNFLFPIIRKVWGIG